MTMREISIATTGGLLLACASVSWAAPSDLDPTFGTNGQTATPAGPQLMAPTSVVIDSRGRIHVLVTSSMGQSLNQIPLTDLLPVLTPPLVSFHILRFTADGILDSTFANGGVLDLELGSLTPIGLAVDEVAQQFVLAGGTDLGIGGGLYSAGAYSAAVARISVSGAYDTSFGEDGIAMLPAQGISQGEAVTLLSNGDILVGGRRGASFVMRLNHDGSLNTQFGDQGVVSIPTGAASTIFSMAEGEDGSLFICGPDSYAESGSDSVGFVVGRLSAEGEPVTGFGLDGWKVIDLGFSASCRDIQPGRDGRFGVVATSSDRLTIAKLLADGSLDTSLNGTGIDTSPFPSYSAPLGPGPLIAIDDDGSLVLGVSGGAISIDGNDLVLISPGPDHATGGILLRKLVGSPELQKEVSTGLGGSSGSAGGSGGGALNPLLLWLLAAALIFRRSCSSAGRSADTGRRRFAHEFSRSSHAKIEG